MSSIWHEGLASVLSESLVHNERARECNVIAHRAIPERGPLFNYWLTGSASALLPIANGLPPCRCVLVMQRFILPQASFNVALNAAVGTTSGFAATICHHHGQRLTYCSSNTQAHNSDGDDQCFQRQGRRRVFPFHLLPTACLVPTPFCWAL